MSVHRSVSCLQARTSPPAETSGEVNPLSHITAQGAKVQGEEASSLHEDEAQEDELDTILAAHRQVTRIAHRVMLILVPDDPAKSDAFAARLDTEGLEYARWSRDQRPEDITQVLLGDTPGDLGLWYRLATVTLMASSLTAGRGGYDPNEPAAHDLRLM